MTRSTVQAGRPIARTLKFSLVAVVAAGLACGVFALSARDKPDTPQEVALGYLNAMASGDFAAAWELSCDDLKNDYGSREKFLVARQKSWDAAVRLLGEVPPAWTGFDLRIDEMTAEQLLQEEVPFNRRPIAGWRVSYSGRYTGKHLVVLESEALRFCGRPGWL